MVELERAEWVFYYRRDPPWEPEGAPHWYLTYETRQGDISPLEDGRVVFRLRAEATEQDARRLKDHLNNLLDQVSYIDVNDVLSG